ncbi:MAG: DUF4249 domain-containing protein [Bacteroidales bacterium]|nr:DUF4249 domain-containing protein [Bacteroidales bacterium]
MKRSLTILAALLALAACTEKTDLRSEGEYNEYLAVDATLTDRADQPQQVLLSRTVPYFGEAGNHAAAAVRGAVVTVADGTQTVLFSEKEPGVYQAPEGYCAEAGRQYRLRIEDGEDVYEAEASMPEAGFRLDDIDYAWAGNKTMGADSLWTVAIWGEDRPEPSYYYVSLGLNGHFYPFELSEVMDDKYFNGNAVRGFPISTLMQVHEMQERYGECCKYLEEGDVITLQALTLQKDYFDYLVAVALNGTLSSIPLFSPQPANCPTNIRGDHALGYFAVCPVVSASVTVEDPLRPYYKKLMPGL